MSFDIILSVLDVKLALAIGVIIIAALISGYTGFGGALFLVPLMVILFGPVEAVAVSRIVGILGRVQLYPNAARTANWSEVFPLFVAIAIVTPFASSVLFIADPELIRRGIGVLVILVSIVMLSGWKYRGSRGWGSSLFFGSLCGGLAGIAGIGGPPMVVYFMTAPDENKVKRANIVMAVALVTLVVLTTFLVKGGIGSSTLVRAAILLPASIVGTWFGNWLFKVAPQTYFRYVALTLLFATGLATVVL
jgi:uncharacterized protein